MTRLARLLFVSLALVVALAGCGGGSGSASPTATTLKVPVQWPALSRALTATESAQSVLVVLSNPDGIGKGFSAFGNRGPDSAAHENFAVSVDKVPAGIWSLQAEFHALAEGAGPVVATAVAIVQVRADGTLLSASGAPLGAITVQSVITGIFVNDGQTLEVGKDFVPVASAFSGFGNIVALAPNAIRYAIVSGGDHASIANGMLHGVAAGDATITAEVDGIVSPPQIVSIVSAGTKLTKVDISASGIVGSPVNNTVYATVRAGAPRFSNSVVAINTADGSITGSVVVGANPQFPTLSFDAKTLYVAVANGASVAKIDLTTMTKTAEFELGNDDNGNPMTVAGLAISPSNPDVVAVSTSWVGAGVQIYQSGVRLGHVDVHGDNGVTAIAYSADGNSVFGVSGTFSPSTLVRVDVDSTGVTGVTNSNVGAGGSIAVAGDRIYAGAGVYDAATMQPIGVFATPDGFVNGSVEDPALRLDWQLSRNRITAFDTTTFARLASFPITSDIINQTSVTRFGAKGIAFLDQNGGSGGSQLELLNIAPGL